MVLLVLLGVATTFIFTGCLDDENPLSSVDTLYVFDTVAADSLLGYGKLKYVGSGECESCHENQYDMFIESGHPYKLNKVIDGKAPTYPSFVTPMILPEGLEWDDVTYVIGGYGWKARFLDENGYIWGTATEAGVGNQFNLIDSSFADYHATDTDKKKFDCGTCHTTGYDPEGDSQDGLEGIVGSWAEPGIQCEECHGPGSYHVDSKGMVPLKVDRTANACGSCHYRGDLATIPSSGGYIKHHEQYNEQLHSKKAGMACIDCHDPHASTKYDDVALGRGIKTSCENCHAKETESYKKGSPGMHADGISCVDCHMAKASKSAKPGATYVGDIPTHLFRISTDSTETQFTDSSKTNSNSFISLEFACLSCHGDSTNMDMPEAFRGQSKGWAAQYAKGVHRPVTASDYVGSKSCEECHQAQYDIFIESGHPYKLNKVIDGKAPTYPEFVPPMILPEGLTWDEVTYVIGGYGWKARFLDTDGYVWGSATQAGINNQFNLIDSSYGDYHATDSLKKKYSCGNCHTTGYDVNAASQDGLPGIVGGWSEPGVHCEACHGPGSNHIESRGNVRMIMDRSTDACNKCHVRNANPTVIPAKGGYSQHREQGNEMYYSKHSVLSCVDCHDPHASSKYDDVAKGIGIKRNCESCHNSHAEGLAKPEDVHAGKVSCTDCHMALVMKSAKAAATFIGDDPTHMFRISTDSTEEQFTEDGKASNPYISLDFACLQCHGDTTETAPMAVPDSLRNMSKGWAAINAAVMHK
jgi:hypothetical protein